MMKYALIVNPVSGLQQGLKKLSECIELLDAKDIHYDVFFTEANVSIDHIVTKSYDLYDIFVIFGGDGTMSQIMGFVYANQVSAPLMVVPSGTSNEFASNLNIESDLESLIDAATSKEHISIDLGIVNQELPFIYALTFGNFTDVTYKTPQKWKNLLGYRAYVLYGFLTFRRIKSYKLTIETNGRLFTSDFIFGSISNSKTIGQVFELENVDFSDGLLEVLLIKKPKSITELRHILKGIMTKDYSNPLFMTFKTDEISIESSKDISWNIDGEFAGKRNKVSVSILDEFIQIVGGKI